MMFATPDDVASRRPTAESGTTQHDDLKAVIANLKAEAQTTWSSAPHVAGRASPICCWGEETVAVAMCADEAEAEGTVAHESAPERAAQEAADRLPQYNLRSPLCIACHAGDVNRVREMIDDGEDLDQFDPECGFTPLQLACETGQVECAHRLLDAGAAVHIGGKAQARLIIKEAIELMN